MDKEEDQSESEMIKRLRAVRIGALNGPPPPRNWDSLTRICYDIANDVGPYDVVKEAGYLARLYLLRNT